MKTTGLRLDQAPPEDIPLRFFISTPFFGLLAGMLVFWKGRELFSNSSLPETIALTHLITQGWMTLVMFGALYQMIPVLIGERVPLSQLSRILHAILIPGVLLMASGFIQHNPWDMKLTLAVLFPGMFLFLCCNCSNLWDRPTDTAPWFSQYNWHWAFWV